MRLILCVCVILLCAPAASAQGVCFPRDHVISQLNGKHSEAVRARALAANGSMLEVWQSVDGSTWSLTVTNPRRHEVTCIIATGSNWEWLIWFLPPVGEKS